MVKLNYSVSAGILELPSGDRLEVGLAHWWDWLESDEAKSFRFECDHGVKNYTARKERVKDLVVWYAYKSVENKLRKRYIGKSDQLTQERLELIAYDLEKAPEPRQKAVLPNSLGNDVGEYRELLNESRRTAAQRESDFERLMGQKIQLQNEVKQLNEILKGRDRNFEEATNQIAHLKCQLEKITQALPSQLGNDSLEVRQLTKERDELDQRVNELEEKTGELGLALQVKDEEIPDLHQQLLDLEGECSRKSDLLEHLRQKLEESQQLERTSRHQAQDLQLELKATKSKLHECQAIASQPLHSEVGNTTDAATLFNQLRPLLSRLNDRERRAVQQKLEAILETDSQPS